MEKQKVQSANLIHKQLSNSFNSNELLSSKFLYYKRSFYILCLILYQNRNLIIICKNRIKQ